MSDATNHFLPEPERYEFRAAPIHHFELVRRDFFKLLGAGIAVFSVAKNSFGTQETAPGPRSFHSEELPKEITSWLHVGEDGTVTGFTGKVEIGQNIRTSLAQTIADELRVPFESVRMVTADTALTPFDAGTFGSRTTPTMTPQFRRVAAAARDLLVGVAAKEWNVSSEGLIAADAKVSDPASGRSVRYAELARGKTGAKSACGRSRDTGGAMENRRQAGSKSRWPRLCYGRSSVHAGPAPGGDALWQSSASALVRRNAPFLR